MLWLNPRALSYATVKFNHVGCIVDLNFLYFVHGTPKAQMSWVIKYRQVVNATDGTTQPSGYVIISLFEPFFGGTVEGDDVSNHYISKSKLEVNGMAINYSRGHSPLESL